MSRLIALLVDNMYEKALSSEDIKSLPDLTANIMEKVEYIFHDTQGEGELKKRVVVKIMRNLCSRQKITSKYPLAKNMTIQNIISMIDVIAKASNQEYAINKNTKVYNIDEENDEDIDRCISCCFNKM